MHLINIMSNIICETLLDSGVIQNARRRPHAFTRNNGKLPYLTVVKMLLENRKLTISAMLDEFFLELWKMSADGVPEPESCTQQAFSKARAGIDHSIFETCFQRMPDFLCSIENLSYCKPSGGLGRAAHRNRWLQDSAP